MSVQTDWSRREFAETIQVQILKMTEFLNKFHLSTRHRLSLINERIGWCERMLDNVESVVLPQEPVGEVGE
jgi:chromosome 3 open reading frame 10